MPERRPAGRERVRIHAIPSRDRLPRRGRDRLLWGGRLCRRRRRGRIRRRVPARTPEGTCRIPRLCGDPSRLVLFHQILASLSPPFLLIYLKSTSTAARTDGSMRIRCIPIFAFHGLFRNLEPALFRRPDTGWRPIPVRSLRKRLFPRRGSRTREGRSPRSSLPLCRSWDRVPSDLFRHPMALCSPPFLYSIFEFSLLILASARQNGHPFAMPARILATGDRGHLLAIQHSGHRRWMMARCINAIFI